VQVKLLMNSPKIFAERSVVAVQLALTIVRLTQTLTKKLCPDRFLPWECSLAKRWQE
jgi:hypothetical protein